MADRGTVRPPPGTVGGCTVARLAVRLAVHGWPFQLHGWPCTVGRPTVPGRTVGRVPGRARLADPVGRPTGSANRARPGTRSAVQPGRRTVHGQEHGQPANWAGQPYTARNTVSRPTGSANRARPETRSAVQPGRRTVHGQEHGRPANRVGQPCTARNTVGRPTASANRARPGTRSIAVPDRDRDKESRGNNGIRRLHEHHAMARGTRKSVKSRKKPKTTAARNERFTMTKGQLCSRPYR